MGATEKRALFPSPRVGRSGAVARVVVEGLLIYGGIRVLVTSGGMLLVAALLISRGDEFGRALALTGTVGLASSAVMLVASLRFHRDGFLSTRWTWVATGAGALDLLINRSYMIGGLAAVMGGVLAAGWRVTALRARPPFRG